MRDDRPVRAVIRVATRITAPPSRAATTNYPILKRQLRAKRSSPRYYANGRILRVVTFDDGETLHNAFYDRDVQEQVP